MITWLVGENSFEIKVRLKKIIKDVQNSVPDVLLERFDGLELKIEDLPNIFMGNSLFASQRLVIIDGISQNSTIWPILPNWLDNLDDSINLVLVDAKPDKRTTTYNFLKKISGNNLFEHEPWSQRDYFKAEKWLHEKAKLQKIALAPALEKHLVRRVGLDQWQLQNALDNLGLLDSISIEQIDEYIPESSNENIFQVFQMALEGKPDQVQKRLKVIKTQHDPFAFFALLTSQALSLAAVAFAESDDNVAKDFSVQPFVVANFKRYPKLLGKKKIANIITMFSLTDADIKRSKAEPWILIEKLLLEIATTS